MRYFKPELWRDSNSHRGRTVRTADKKWTGALNRYRRDLKKLMPDLSVSARRFFGRVSLHDAALVSFLVDRESPKKGLRVTGVFLHPSNGRAYSLSYSQVTRLEVSHPGRLPLFDDMRMSIGSWGYDELTRAGGGALRHEILFSTGTTIVIEFERFRYATSKTV
jgi:hypothetical protein